MNVIYCYFDEECVSLARAAEHRGEIMKPLRNWMQIGIFVGALTACSGDKTSNTLDVGTDSMHDVGQASDTPADTHSDVRSDQQADIGVDAGLMFPAAVILQNATATHSQSTYDVGEAINQTLAGTNDGWAIDPLQGSDVIAVFETASNTPDFGGKGSRLSFHMIFAKTNNFFLGSFRLWVTTVDRAMFADGMSTGGDIGADGIWNRLDLAASATSSVGSLNEEDNGSFFIDDATGVGSYDLVFDTPLEKITGVKLEALTDNRLPGEGPGLNNGNFVLTEFEMSVEPGQETKLTFQNPTATFSQSMYSVSEAVDGNTTGVSGHGWAISPNWGMVNTAAFETTTDTGAFSNGTVLRITLNHTSLADFALGKFRISITKSDRSMFADGMDNGGDIGLNGIWTPLVPTLVKDEDNGASFTIDAQGVVLASDENSTDAIYEYVATTPVTGITGVRLQAINDASLPNGGPGLKSDGNFVLTEFEVTAAPAP